MAHIRLAVHRPAVRAAACLALTACACSNKSHLRTADGRDRLYLVRTPPEWDGQARLPVVLMLHGGGGDMDGTEASTGMTAAGLEAGFMVVYPEGVGKKVLGRRFATWNAGACCGTAMQEQVDDVAFIRALIDTLVEERRADPERIYVAGLSNGGLMSGRLACALADRIAAAGPVAGSYFDDTCQPSRPVPMFILHGTADQCVPFEGGATCGGCFDRALEEVLDRPPEVHVSFPCQGPAEAAAFWRAKDQCAGQGRTSQPAPDTTCVTYDGCAEDAEVVACTIAGGGHTWPGGKFTCNPRKDYCKTYKETVGTISAFDANRALLAFFARHRRR